MTQAHTSSDNFLKGGGQMGALMRAYDWAASPLGPCDGWSPTLKTVLRLLLTTNHPIIVFWGPQLIQFYNDAYSATLGPERHPAILGRPGKESWQEVWHIIGPDVEQVMSGGESTWHEDKLVPLTRHGRKQDVWWNYGYSPIEDAEGVQGALVICNDVTAQHHHTAALNELNRTLEERVRARTAELEEASREHEKRRRLYETILSTTPDLVYVFDLEHRFSYANAMLLQMWGQDWDNAIGKTCLELGYEPWHAEMHDREIEHVKRTRQSIRGEVPFDGAFGRRIYDYIFVPVLGPDGEVEAVAGSTRDVTEYKQIENELKRNQAHLTSLFAQSAAGITEGGVDGVIRNVNQRFCEMMACEPSFVMGKSMRALTHPDDLAASVALFERLVATGAPFEIEKRYVRPDGSAIWANTAVSLIRDETGQSAPTVLAVVLDISERKKAEEALLDAARRKDEFLAMLAHELRNPLAPISSAAELLALGRLDGAGIERTSAIISRQVRHMTGLVDDLMDVSRVTRGLASLDKRPLDPKQVMLDAVEQVRPLIDARGHRLTLTIHDTPARVMGDRKRLVQVLSNLLNNAAKYTPDGGNIALTLEVGQDALRIAVADDGIGMDAQLTERAFEPFVQAERTSDRSQGGLGIGLALVRSLVALHGGEAGARSDGLGRGSTFTITLPVAEPDVPAAAAAGAAGARTGASPLKILVVDDNQDAAEMLAFTLRADGHEAIVENDPLRALATAREIAPQVCLLDIGLPVIDGNELARRLRADPATAGAVLVAVTGYSHEQDRDEAARAGFDHYFVKPVDSARLAPLLDAIGRSRAARA
ncbi:PAS domain S-box protein [Massilia sp. R2A-15]|uniref:hybrid sensor histidine kinase/response regulator n=1 Tax=Massilia sp. R2A-15 TaxID=3064278 RepID=UPI002733A748|nr:PAS domain S-box protein [Massilia sp. R2A-15]WLI90811.1 PAS domain S-box protein [Massilia sp. R2A-15]